MRVIYPAGSFFAKVICSGENLTVWQKSSYNMLIKTRKIMCGTPYSCPTKWGAPWIFTSLYVFYEKVFQNLQMFCQTVRFSPEHSTLAMSPFVNKYGHIRIAVAISNLLLHIILVLSFSQFSQFIFHTQCIQQQSCIKNFHQLHKFHQQQCCISTSKLQ
jgi:hypothetical protein